ncbi:MAG: ImmA/IrrE family metallo-endopeptidase [Deltaproteobacteria bacterium]|nr:ImmA/IrrE family metallo-endopeptidase [Deltaproteobacteria bacterium]
MTEHSDRLIEIAFGSRAANAEAAAQASGRVYVRGLGQLAEDHPKATGRRLTALEALRTYGIEVLAEVGAEGYAKLARAAEVAGRVLKLRREQLGLDRRHVALRAGLPEDVVRAAEESRKLSIRSYERVARALGLDERYVSVRPEPEGNERIAVRLRTIGEADPRLGAGTVSALAEAAWVAMTQIRLEEELGLVPPRTGIEHSNNYGTPGFPAYQWGYQLAADARSKLGLGAGPILSMRSLAEERLGLPVIQAELGEAIAGVTIETVSRRAIVINLSGENRHVFVRRATVAHELGHLLYDPQRSLRDLRVDAYGDLDKPAEELPDPVEQRANAFAADFLVPQSEAVTVFRSAKTDGLGEVMYRFGVSFTAARYQIWNGIDRKGRLEDLRTERRAFPAEWEGRETYTVDYHPIPKLRPTRAGRFGAVAARAAEEGLISWDTAGEWLEVSADEVRRVVPQLRELFPAVWSASGRQTRFSGLEIP